MDQRIRMLVDERLAEMNSCGLMKNPVVPTEMAAGPADDEGWIPWKAIPSTITPDEVTDLQERIGYKLPTLFVELILYKHFMELAFDNIRFIPLPANEGIRAVQTWVQEQSEALGWLQNGIIIFAFSTDDESYYCFNAMQPMQDENSLALDYPVVILDPTIEGNLQERLAYNSFADLVRSLLGHQD